MKKSLFQTINLPEGITASLNKAELCIKSSQSELKRSFDLKNLVLEIKDNAVVVGSDKATKTEKRMMNTIAAHVKNMIKGVTEGFEYKLKICFSHFPFTVSIDGDKATIKNFLGEKIDRYAKIIEGTQVKLEKEFITVNSADRELAGQTAANLEIATKVRGRDLRVFQDGIYIINKCGREM